MICTFYVILCRTAGTYVIFMQLCKANCTYFCSWNIHGIKKIPQNQYHVYPDSWSKCWPSYHPLKLPPRHTPPSPRSIERPTLFCIMSIFQSLCSIECPTLFCTMSVFQDFGSDIFLLHIIYSLFSVLFCLHYTVINLLYRKFT